MDCLGKLRAGPLCKMDRCLFTENLLRIQIGSAKYAQSTLEPELKRISGYRARASDSSSDQLLQEHDKYLRESRYLAYPPVEDYFYIAGVRQDLQARSLPLYAFFRV